MPYKPPEKFEFSKPEQWPSWRQRFERYRIASKLNKDDIQVQISALIYSMGPEAEKIFTVFSEENFAEFSEVLNCFNNHFIPKVNTIHERALFHQRSQKPGENIEGYVRSLYDLAEHAQFHDKDSAIRDRLVVGIRDIDLSEKLQLNANLLLPEALTLARQHEQVKRQIGEQRPATVAVEAINRIKQGSKFTKKSNHKNVINNYNKEKNTMCGRCGKQHGYKQCPAFGKVCNKCKKKNHFSNVCRNKEDPSVSEFWIDSCNAQHNIVDECSPWYIDLDLINTGKFTKFKIDTGADISVIKRSDFDLFSPTPDLTPSFIKLDSPGGKIVPQGEFSANVKKHNKIYKFKVLVIPSKVGNNLLSRAVSEKMGLVKRLENVVNNNVFGPMGLLKTDPVKIKLRENAIPYSVGVARRVPFPLLHKVEMEINRMKKAGVIKEMKEPTEWCAPMVPVIKPNGDVRICIDFKKLNQSVKRPFCMLPNLDDIAPKLSGSKVFSTLDASAGFFQVPIHEDSQPLTTFITPFGRYCFERVPMGISLGPECFQIKMKELLEGMDGCEVIMDDIIVYGRDAETHDIRLQAVLNRIESSGMKLNKEKCSFQKSSVKFFGQNISEKGIRPLDDRIKAITDLEPPNSVTELRTICGVFNYMSKYIPNLATIIKPVTDLLKKNSTWQWDVQQSKAFTAAKEAISSATSLAFYKIGCKTVVSADSSSYGMGAVIMQEQEGEWRAIAFASRTLNESERRYAQIEKECLASVWACEKFRKYLIGLDSFDLETDHKPLVPLMMNKDLDNAPVRIQRLLIRLMRFNANVIHVPGKELLIADTLSRHPLKIQSEDNEISEVIDAQISAFEINLPFSPDRLKNIKSAIVHDSEFCKIINYVLNGWPQEVPDNLKMYQQYKSELYVINGLLVYNQRIAIPSVMRTDILAKLHESHQGLHKCRERAQETVWWPGLSRDLQRLVSNCMACRENRPSQKHEPLKPTELPDRPWQKIGADLLTFNSQTFLSIVDYYSRWIEIIHLNKTTANSVVNKCKQLFAVHGIPEILVSDNGPQFQGDFKEFAEEYDFHHVTSSPVFPQANGAAESSVKIAKKILQQNSPDIALLNYRTTPHSSTGVCPSVALMGRMLRTRLPILPVKLVPRSPNDNIIRERDESVKQKFKENYDKHHGTLPLKPLVPGEHVLMKTDSENQWKSSGTVVAGDSENRTYLVSSPSGVLRRNRKHLQNIPESTDTQKELPPSDTPLDTPGDAGMTTPLRTSEPEVPSGRVTRAASGCVTNKPIRYRD